MKYPDQSSIENRERVIDWKPLVKTTFPSGIVGLESKIGNVWCMVAYDERVDMVVATFGIIKPRNVIDLQEVYGLTADETLLFRTKVGN